ncbi:alginate export family protein [Novosphingobium flavum]|uniref:Alginate export family protein n=1 Tax=Novosphingobium flavum TaxID=1778672 RepID=A0A7X1FNI7_9SPHN|nr:alginate export family protein [Novosphingobium flavum]MBC2664056.1 alginate export family protein [Novosphingobium flavum]
MGNRKFVAALAALPLTMVGAQAAHAAPGDPVKFADGLTFDPIIEGRLRYEGVDTPTVDADAVTMRLRAGFEIKSKSGLSFLAEGEGTLGIDNSYNAFPFAVASHQRRTQYAVVSDPENIDLNRLQIAYRTKKGAITIGRQRINLDDQRFVGSVAWRQNEQTFDAVRGEATLGPVSLDVTYANAQRSIFGVDAGPRQSYGGDFVFAGAGMKLGPVNAKAFSYLLSYDEAFFFANSSASYGGRATASLPLTKAWKLNLAGSYARQTDYGTNPVRYKADYVAAEAALAGKALTVTAGYELLGGDAKAGKSFQTPMATLHKFNGFADLFLTTPQTAAYGGLQDLYGGIAYKFDGVKALPGLNAAVTYHQFDSDYGNLRYGTEWNATLGFKVKRYLVSAKYANYQAQGFGVDTKKLWLQIDFAY